jgi:hypothetical protein
MAFKTQGIRNLQLMEQADLAFFRLFNFNRASHFNRDPLPMQQNLIRSLSDPHKWLQYSQHSPRFYEVAKSADLLDHWKKILGSSESHLHPFDELLQRECQEMRNHARDENNSELARNFEELESRFSNRI